MSTINDGGPAFPIATHHVQSIANAQGETVGKVSQELGTYPGMTLRDWFAGMAMQGYLAGRNHVSDLARDCFTQPQVSRVCYGYADAMLASRERKDDA